MDFQIKFNGYRIELEDVSQNLNEIQVRWISSCLSSTLGNKDQKVQNLLAYVILKDEHQRTIWAQESDITKAIKEDLEDIMMSYMITI